jgi:hypothetical protein
MEGEQVNGVPCAVSSGYKLKPPTLQEGMEPQHNERTLCVVPAKYGLDRHFETKLFCRECVCPHILTNKTVHLIRVFEIYDLY